MPFLTANKIHDGAGWLPEGTVIEVSDAGEIISVGMLPNAGVVFYDGVLAPGFVNVHCHLELCHMKGAVPEHTGLIPFLKTIPLHRNDFTDVQKEAARMADYHELLRNGVVAVGDIANTTDTLDVRALDGLHFQTFVESIGFTEANAQRAFEYALKTYGAFAAQQPKGKLLRQAIVPHAPYSVSAALFRLIDGHRDGGLLSIHNQESMEENRFYVAKEGGVRDLLGALGIDDSPFVPTGQSSIRSYLEWIAEEHPFVFVHNTYTMREEVRYAQSHIKEAHWCLCPNANLYIENQLPDIDMLVGEGASICVGTDSLASNHGLSVLGELVTIKKHYPHIGWETLINWGTGNGARALQMQDIVGYLMPGTKPGIIQISGLENMPAVRRVV